MAEYLRPHDLAVAIQLALNPNELYQALASGLHLSISSVHRSVKRLQMAGLIEPGKRKTNRSALIEFVKHGAKYAFPAERGPEVRGVPTAWSVPGLMGDLSPSSGNDVVWADAEGDRRGESVTPLYSAAPSAAREDERLHRSLALIDAIRIGQARERRQACDELRKELQA